MKTPIEDLDIIFISYNEDNAEENWNDLKEKYPFAKRVHGVKGFDAAHKEAARQSTTDRFITVDGDCIVDESFFDIAINFESPKFKNTIISWAGKNTINGLIYGNGGLKCWPKNIVLNMHTHESATSHKAADKIEFCWKSNYVQMNQCFSTTKPNASAQQAFRIGFREGVKMSLDGGECVDKQTFKDNIWYGNYQRLLIWMNVGADVKHGLWAVLGSRLGCHDVMLKDNWDYTRINDLDYINDLYNKMNIGSQSTKKDKFNLRSQIYEDNQSQQIQNELISSIEYLGYILNCHLDLNCCLLDEQQSRFFKDVYIGIPRMGKLMTEEEINELIKLNR